MMRLALALLSLGLVAAQMGCNYKKGCWTSENLNGSYQMGYFRNGTDPFVTVELEAYIPTSSTAGNFPWVAVALSNDTHMGGDYVLWCTAESKTSMFYGYTNVTGWGTPSHVGSVTTLGSLVPIAWSYVNNFLYCAFQVNITIPVNANMVAAGFPTNINSLSNATYLLGASGNNAMTGGAPGHHNVGQAASQSNHITLATTYNSPSLGFDCNHGKSCWYAEGLGSGYMMSFVQNPSNVSIEIQALIPPAKGTFPWVAVALSSDQSMGSDYAFWCSGAITSAYNGYTTMTPSKVGGVQTVGTLTTHSWTSANNLLYCLFEVPLSVGASVVTNTMGFSMSNATGFYLLGAAGDNALPNGIIQHHKGQIASIKKYYLGNFVPMNSSAVTIPSIILLFVAVCLSFVQKM